MNAVDRLKSKLSAWTGIDLHRGGRGASLERFLELRVRTLGLASADAFVDGLRGPEDPEVQRLVSVVTVGHTWFFRDAGQMLAIAELLEGGFGRAGCVHVWIPGCSTGEDAFTIAMLAHRARRRVHVLATDINAAALEHAREATYGSWSVRELPPELRGGLIPRGRDLFEVAPVVRSMVQFQRHNLLDAPPPTPDGSGWRIVLCRNVLIYFPPAAASSVVTRLGESLAPGGWLLVGASEVIHTEPAGLTLRPLGGRYGLQRLDEDVAPNGAPLRAEVRRASPLPHAPPVTRPTFRPEPLSGIGSERTLMAPTLPVLGGSPTPPIRPVSSGIPAPAPGSAAGAAPGSTEPAGEAEALARGHDALESGDAERAVVAFSAASAIDPLCAESRMYCGIAHHLRGDSSAAIHELRAAVFLDPDLWPASFYLALNYEKLGLATDAQREFDRVVRMSDRKPLLRSQSSVLGDIETWKRDVVSLATARARRRRDPAEA